MTKVKTKMTARTKNVTKVTLFRLKPVSMGPTSLEAEGGRNMKEHDKGDDEDDKDDDEDDRGDDEDDIDGRPR